ncbi:hypothetical protein GCK32_021702, partial [Trichostrongylus colubriformis]
YSDFDVALHRQLRKYALALLEQEGGRLTERFVKMINWNMAEATKRSDWQCIFGTAFSACLEYERGSLLHFCIGDHAILLFRCNSENPL